jgi:CheY-like chemotaxis protein
MVFMDIQMPGIDGYETTRRIRGMEDNRPPIVALTANAMPEHCAASLAAGMDDHVPKPVRRDLLAAALTRWAGARPVEDFQALA